jgi:hypothetical protein
MLYFIDIVEGRAQGVKPPAPGVPYFACRRLEARTINSGVIR